MLFKDAVSVLQEQGFVVIAPLKVRYGKYGRNWSPEKQILETKVNTRAAMSSSVAYLEITLHASVQAFADEVMQSLGNI